MDEHMAEPFCRDEPMERFLNALLDGISYTNEDGIVVYANNAYYMLTGLSAADILGRSIYELVESGFPVSRMVLDVFQTRQTKTESIQYGSDENHEILVSAIPIYDDKGIFRGAATNFRDLEQLNSLRRSLGTTYLHYEQQIEKLDRANLLLQSRINELMRSKGDGVVAKSKQMRSILELAYRVGQTRSTVLITGESGVGKDVICRFINNSAGNHTPYIKISCGAIPETLLESELFGYEPGAFSGASRQGKIGIFELAGDGVAFLDEIGEMPLHLQVKLLTVLQDRSYLRVGGTKRISMNAQVIAATNRNLKEEVAQGRFRQDLYYRLNVVPINIPPLRERKEDILPLAELFLEQLNRKHNSTKRFSAGFCNAFLSYDWPGNVRELNNIVERIYILSTTALLDVTVLPPDLREIIVPRTGGTLKTYMEQAEATFLESSLQDNMTLQEVADSLGINLSTLIRKIKKYHLPRRYLTKKQQ